MTELDKLEEYLIRKEIKYQRFDQEESRYGRDIHQIVVYDDHGRRSWDAICHKGSYGEECGLLEVMGGKVVRVDSKVDDVEGYLKAEQIIERLENG